MKPFTPVFGLLLVAAVVGGFAGAARADMKPTKILCDVGPIVKVIGGSQWLVSSCEDGRSLVIVSATGNPAMPYYFMLSPVGNGYRVRGEGTGNPEFTAAALKEIQTLSLDDIESMIAATQAK